MDPNQEMDFFSDRRFLRAERRRAAADVPLGPPDTLTQGMATWLNASAAVFTPVFAVTVTFGWISLKAALEVAVYAGSFVIASAILLGALRLRRGFAPAKGLQPGEEQPVLGLNAGLRRDDRIDGREAPSLHLTSGAVLWVQHSLRIGTPSMTQTGRAGLVQRNHDRMNQVLKFGNTLYGRVNTAITDPSGQTAGIAYWGIKPAWSSTGKLDGGIVMEGYVSVPGNNVAYPSIAVNKDGKGMMAFSLMGPDYYPSAAFVRFDAEAGAAKTVHVAGAGVAPYASFGVVPGVSAGRWGDYSAVADDQGNVWAAAEYIPITSFGATANGGLANWGTFIWKLTP